MTCHWHWRDCIRQQYGCPFSQESGVGQRKVNSRSLVVHRVHYLFFSALTVLVEL